MANPPFNQKDWRAENELKDDPRWRGYDTPPKSNANYAWILNMVSKLSENGVAGFILANGALSGGGEEYKIRRTLIENNLVEAILVLPRNLFYTTDISVTLWILNKNKKAQSKSIGEEKRNYREREKEILFMDLRQLGEPFEKKYTQFSDDDIKKVTSTYHLKKEFPDMGLSPRNLWNMKLFYERYRLANPKLLKAVAVLPWGHNLLLINKVQSLEAVEFYANEAVAKAWSRDWLLNAIKMDSYAHAQKQIKSHNFSETLTEIDADYANEVFKDTYNLGFLGITEKTKETEFRETIGRKNQSVCIGTW